MRGMVFGFLSFVTLSFCSSPQPHLTPEKLVGSMFDKDVFGDIKVAIVGFCPPPKALDKYKVEDTNQQYFIHVSPDSVKICEHNGQRFLSIFHVYGGPVSSALMEELKFYGIEHVLVYGLCGGFGTKDLKMGDLYIVESALSKDGTTKSYTDEAITFSDVELNTLILNKAEQPITRVHAVTTDVIYREYLDFVKEVKAQGCDIVNCDSAHLFATCKSVGLKTTQVGIVSDVASDSEENWDSDLSNMLKDNSDDKTKVNPLERVNIIIDLYIQKILPALN